MIVVSADTETFLMRPGVQAPPVVCLQAMEHGKAPYIAHANPRLGNARESIASLLRNPNVLLNGHRAAYDMACIASTWPEFLPDIFAAYDADRIVCTVVMAKLADIAAGIFSPQRTYHLTDVLGRLVKGFTLDKEGPSRLEYGTLYDKPVSSWPKAAIDYALGDATAQDLVYHELIRVTPKEHLADMFRQSRRDFMLYLQSCWGIRTDRVQVEGYYAETLVEAENDREIAKQEQIPGIPGYPGYPDKPRQLRLPGLVRGPRPPGQKGSWKEDSRNLKAAMSRMVQVMTGLGEPIPLTETGEERRKEMAAALGREVTPLEVYQASGGEYVSLDEDACLASGDDALEAFQRYGSLRTTLSRVDRLRHGYDLPIQARFNSLMETGRTSCSQGDVEEGVSPPAWGSQVQNPPRKAGVRECFVARNDPGPYPYIDPISF